MAKAKAEQFAGTGRRKSSVARVILKVGGKGKITINGKDIKDYMPYETLIIDINKPLTLTESNKKYDVIVNVVGGGFTGQAGAIRLGIARALLNAGADRATLKDAGLLTRDSRAKERKKYGLKGARRAPQFSKR